MTDPVPNTAVTTEPIYQDLHGILDRMQDQLGAATGKRHVIVRCEMAGVFAGLLHWRSGTEVVLLDARRLWYWAGAATLSELALRGTNDPRGCTFPPPVGEITLLGVCEIIPTTPAARISIANVPEWTAWTDKELADAARTEGSPAGRDPHDGSGTAPGRGNTPPATAGFGDNLDTTVSGWEDGSGAGDADGEGGPDLDGHAY